VGPVPSTSREAAIGMNDNLHQRRDSDRADLRAERARQLGDHTARVIADAQAAIMARRRHAEWDARTGQRARAIDPAVGQVIAPVPVPKPGRTLLPRF